MLLEDLCSKRQRARRPSPRRADSAAVETVEAESLLLHRPPGRWGAGGQLQECASCLILSPASSLPTCQSCHMAAPPPAEPGRAAASRHTQGSHMLARPPGMRARVLPWHGARCLAQLGSHGLADGGGVGAGRGVRAPAVLEVRVGWRPGQGERGGQARDAGTARGCGAGGPGRVPRGLAQPSPGQDTRPPAEEREPGMR